MLDSEQEVVSCPCPAEIELVGVAGADTLDDIIDLIVDTGINGLHPIDPNAGMDLGLVKEKYGDRICLMGNDDCAHILTWGTIEEVRAEVKRCSRQAARSGGHICMSSNSIHSAVKPENYIEMVRELH